MSKEYLVRKINLTGLVKWMNSNYKKQTNKDFTSGDVQQYIVRGHLPAYLGNNPIEKEDGYLNVKLYKIVKNEKSNSELCGI